MKRIFSFSTFFRAPLDCVNVLTKADSILKLLLTSLWDKPNASEFGRIATSIIVARRVQVRK